MTNEHLTSTATDTVIYSIGAAGVILSQIIDFSDHHLGFVSGTIMLCTFVGNNLWKYFYFRYFKKLSKDQQLKESTNNLKGD